jgi:ATPase family associated with various cellular activities (AAA)
VYRRDDDEARSELAAFVVKLREAWRNDYGGKRAFLIWGPPGEGKTSLVTNFVAAQNTDGVPASARNEVLLEIRMDCQDPRSALRHEILKAGKSSGLGYVVMLFDEVDSGQPKRWLPPKLLDLIDNGVGGRPAIVVLVGSHRGGIEQLKKRLLCYSSSVDTKIDDVLSRIGNKEVSIPPLDIDDMLALIASLGLANGKVRFHAWDLYYFLIKYYGATSRDLRDAALAWFSATRSRGASYIRIKDQRFKTELDDFKEIHKQNYKALKGKWLYIKA